MPTDGQTLLMCSNAAVQRDERREFFVAAIGACRRVVVRCAVRSADPSVNRVLVFICLLDHRVTSAHVGLSQMHAVIPQRCNIGLHA